MQIMVGNRERNLVSLNTTMPNTIKDIGRDRKSIFSNRTLLKGSLNFYKGPGTNSQQGINNTTCQSPNI